MCWRRARLTHLARLLLLELAEQAWFARGEGGLPGHFLVKFRIGGRVVMDLLRRRCSRRAAGRRFANLPAERPADDLELPLEFFLRGTPRRHILARLLRNLKEIYRSAEVGRASWPCSDAWSSSCRTMRASCVTGLALEAPGTVGGDR